MSRVIGFFATRNDLLDLLLQIEQKRPIHFAESGMTDNQKIAVYSSAADIPGLSSINVHESVQGRILLITDVAIPFANEAVQQRRGGVRYYVSQKANPDTISLAPGGQFDVQTILAGNFGTCTDSTISEDLINMVAGKISSNWSRVQSYFVGQEAATVLDSGGRLTAILKSPREYDLKR